MTVCAARIEPRKRVCACGAAVLETEAGPLALPEIYPLSPCQPCKGRGVRTMRLTAGRVGTLPDGPERNAIGALARSSGSKTRTSCPDCAGTGVQGEPLTRWMVLVDGYGRVRGYDGAREPGEAAYRRHEC